MSEHERLVQLGLASGALAGQAAVVTGAGRGIGYEAARALAALGAQIVIAELSESGRAAAASIQAAGGVALWIQTDVSDAASVAALACQTREAVGPVDILINNAIVAPVIPLLELETARWDQVIAVNLRGAFLTCRAFLPDMIARQGGIIVNMVSTDAMPGMAAYIASKQGLVGLSQSLALEVGDQGVRVIAFAPGMVDTPGIRDVSVRLAPRLGMTPEAFLSATLHPAYEHRLMPAADAGLATAYLVAKLTADYHGEVVNGYEVLERAGYLSAPGVALPTPVAEPRGAPAAVSLPQVLALIQRLQAILDETGAEFDKLPVFARPLAKRGFKSKSGRSLQVWAQTLTALHDRVKAGDSARLQAELPGLQEALERLAVYYHEVPQETARFTRDAEVLQEIGRIAAEREGVIHDLVNTVATLGGDA